MLHSVGDVVALSVLPALNRHGKRGCTMDYVQLIVILSRYCRSIIVEVWYHKVEVSYNILLLPRHFISRVGSRQDDP